jgi:hypothetical protein
MWVDGTGFIQAHMHRFGAVDNRLYVTNATTSNLTGVYLASFATSWTSTSDERLKTDITPLTGVLDRIKGIRVASFNMADLGVAESGDGVNVTQSAPRVMRDGTAIKQQIGSIAQDWLKSFPEVVVEPTTNAGYYGLNYDRIGVVAVAGVQELTALVEAKDAEIKALNARLAALEQMVERLASQAGQK